MPGGQQTRSIWSWGDEIVVGFTVGYVVGKVWFPTPETKAGHSMPMQARSMDGGETWRVVEMPGRTPRNRGLSADEHVLYDLSVAQALVEET